MLAILVFQLRIDRAPLLTCSFRWGPVNKPMTQDVSILAFEAPASCTARRFHYRSRFPSALLYTGTSLLYIPFVSCLKD